MLCQKATQCSLRALQPTTIGLCMIIACTSGILHAVQVKVLKANLCRLQGANKDTKDLSACMTRQRADMARLNSALADTTAEKAQLEDDVFTLQGEIEQVTKVSSWPFCRRNFVLVVIQ